MTTYNVVNPATEEHVTTVTLTTERETDEAISKAVLAQKQWAAESPAARAKALKRFAAAVDDNIDTLASLELTNSGHPISQARWEAEHVRDVIDYYSAAPERLMGRQIPVENGLDVTVHEPLGVVGVITPWNFPMTTAAWGFAPALAAGNAVVLKPAEWTPLSSIELGELALESGLPEGLFQVLPGKGSIVGERFVTNQAVRKIVFTGSTAVGKRIMQQSASDLTRITLELGGKSANIVFADADIEQAAAAAPFAVFDNAGQDCCARSRILVQRDAYDTFMEHFETAVQNMRVGAPEHADTEMGPLISASHRDHVQSFITPDTNVAFTGNAPEGNGYWFKPTVVIPKTVNDPLHTDEIFGPVVSVVPFDDEHDAYQQANATPYGLAGSIWTRDVGKALRASRAVEAGNLSVNSNSAVRYSTPFGGFKQSGYGRELGPDAPLSFTETKNIFISTH